MQYFGKRPAVVAQHMSVAVICGFVTASLLNNQLRQAMFSLIIRLPRFG
ncbi:MAG: hypothetical protein GY759_19185 [Chloroflexi bacterium]|nr:hypothetical protein [Chloroflexota bacterium]